jgi:bifunctional UDP-N-acetylglucosamine pyrophosphorylase / glucosamine-1-phosphate N-acetyltransferase
MSHAVADTQVKESGGKLSPATSELKAIILAAGKEAITSDGQPLVLQALGERSILDCVVQNALQVVSPKDIYIVVGYRQEEVRATIGKGKYHYVEQVNPLGTGHAVLQAVEKLKDFRGNVLILYGDTPLFRPASIRGLLNRHNLRKASLTLLTAVVDRPLPYDESFAMPMGRSLTSSRRARHRRRCARFAS